MGNCKVAEIRKACGKNAPGLKLKLYVAHVEEVSAIPAADTDTLTVSTDITMRAAAAGPPVIDAGVFHQWDISSREQDFNSEQDENGMWNTTCQVVIDKVESAKSYILSNLGDDSQIVIATDKNGNKRIIGSVEEPANVRVREQATPRNGYVVTITWQSPEAPLFYTGDITV